MPTYEYACTSCGEHLEVVQSFRDDALTECPACGGKLRKVFGSIGVVFKGSGFYKTDSRPSSGSGDKAAASAATEKSGSTSSSSESSGSSSSDATGDGATSAGDSGSGTSGGSGSSSSSEAGSSGSGKAAAAAS